jgi:hypothetical protein
MADDAGKDIWFINGMLPWTQDMLTNQSPSAYAKTLFQDLDDDQTQDFSERLRNNLELIDWTQWINPWHSIVDFKLDHAPLDDHPGPATHRKIADMIYQRIDTSRETQ